MTSPRRRSPGRLNNDIPDAVREDVSAALAHLEGQTGLADTRRTGQGEQPDRAADEQPANELQLLRASQEGCRVGPAAGREDGGGRRGLRHGRSARRRMMPPAWRGYFSMPQRAARS